MSVKRKYPINEKKFDKINNENAYWIGLLYADGSSTNENKIRLWFQSQDIGILKQFRNWLQTNDRPIKQKVNNFNKPCCGLEFRSWRVHNKLKKYELTTIKPKRHRLHIDLLQPEIRRHFTRGVFDGDGGFYIDTRGYMFVEITGYKPMLRDLKNILVADNIISEKKKIVKNGNVWRIRLSAGDTLKFGKYIYSDAEFYIRRKFNQYKSHAERLNNLGHKKLYVKR